MLDLNRSSSKLLLDNITYVTHVIYFNLYSYFKLYSYINYLLGKIVSLFNIYVSIPKKETGSVIDIILSRGNINFYCILKELNSTKGIYYYINSISIYLLE